MNKENAFEVKINGTDVTPHVVFPIKWSNLLDERLDEARVSLKALATPVYPAMSLLSIAMTDRIGNTLNKNYYVSSDSSYESPPGSGKYNHDLALVEETKFLEGFLIDSVTFTNDLGRNYTNNVVLVAPKITSTDPVPVKTDEIPSYTTPRKIGENFEIVSGETLFYTELHTPGAYPPTLIEEESSITLYHNDREVWVMPIKQSRSIVLETGSYSIFYKVVFDVTVESKDTNVTFEFFAVENVDPLPKWNIASVIDRLLAIAETKRDGDPPRFTLDETIRAKLATIESPEFAFTANTLKEALDQIGGFIHAIPRLNGSVITYDFLGEMEMSAAATYPYMTETYGQDIENYCSKIDSRVDNLVNTVEDFGTITEPYYYAYKSVRTETAFARIEDSNMIIETTEPIESVYSVTCGILPGVTYAGGDLTPYVFEWAEYNRMSSYSENYPDSKSYALYFTQGENNINGLNFKVADVTEGALKNYAIINILRSTSGHQEYDISTSDTEAYPKLAFRVTYRPFFAARIQQTKSYVKGLVAPRTLAYNQGANVVESKYYGENMKGVVARMGNVERSRTFVGQKLTSIPKAGQLFDDDYYIAGVSVEFDPYDYKCTLALSKDFNRLSQYIGINSQKRYYEVSEKAAFRRAFTYTDYLVVGDAIDPEETMIRGVALNSITQIFTQVNPGHPPISYVQAKGVTSGGNDLMIVMLPVISTAFGNAMVFTFKYEDNYSAGDQAVHFAKTGEDGSTVSGYFEQGVPYADIYGRIEKLRLAFSNTLIHDGSFDVQTQIALMLPESYGPDGEMYGIMGTGEKYLVIKKDSREALAGNYEIEYVTNRPRIVLGAALSQNCPLVRSGRSGHGAKLYALQHKVPKFAEVVDVTGATLLESYEGTDKVAVMVNGVIRFDTVTSTVDCVAWALVDGETNELLIAENAGVASGQEIPLPYITPRHEIIGI